MAFVALKDGTVVHTSQIVWPGEKRPARALGKWQDVWERIDATPREGDGMEVSYFNPTTERFFYGRKPVIDELTRQVLQKVAYGQPWLAHGPDDRERAVAMRHVRAEVIKLWRNFVTKPPYRNLRD